MQGVFFEQLTISSSNINNNHEIIQITITLYKKKNSKRSRGPHNDDHEIQRGQATVLHTFLISQEINSNHSGLRQAWRSHQITSTLNLLPVGPKFTRPACRAEAAAIERYQPRPAPDLSSKPAARSRAVDRQDRQTDGRTD